MRLLRFALAALFITLLSVPSPSHAAQDRAARFRQRRAAMSGDRFLSGEALVSLPPGTSAEAARAALPPGLAIKRSLRAPGVFLVSIAGASGARATGAETLKAVEMLRVSGRFRSVSPNYVRPFLDVPNDPSYSQQWYLPQMNLPAVWSVQKGAGNVTIALLDSGCDVTHPDLAARIVGSKNYMDGSSDVTDNLSHGTVVAGIACASTNNATGVAGVAWQGVGLYVAKVGDTFSDPPNVNIGAVDSAVIDAIAYVRANLNAGGKRVVLCLPFGKPEGSDSPDPTTPLNAAILGAANDGIVVCIAAGDTYDQGNAAIGPANLASLHPNILCVAACGSKKEHAYYSQARPYTTITAPGGNDPTFSDANQLLLSTFARNTGIDYFYDEGTSMAAGAAAGVVSLLLSEGADPGEVRQALINSADAVGRAVPNPEFGYGVIDANGALAQLQAGAQIVSPASGAYVYGAVTSKIEVSKPAKFVKAELRVDNDPAVLATITDPTKALTFDSTARNADDTPRYANGTHTLNVAISLSGGSLALSRLVKVDNPFAQITSPGSTGYARGSVDVLGTADGLRTPTYSLEYAKAAAPATWKPIVTNQTTRVKNGLLAAWNLAGVPDGAGTIRLRVKNPDGYETSATTTLTIDQTAPSTPSRLSASRAHQSVSLSWTASTDNFQLAGYLVYRSSQSLQGYTKLTAQPISGTSLVDPNLTNGRTYFYKVSAVDAAGNESAPSDAVDATPNRNGTAGGQVVALDGTFLGDATVSVLQNGQVVPNGSTKTDGAGQFAFPAPPGFPDGTYDIRVTKPGFVPQEIHDVALSMGKDALDLGVTLQPQPAFPAGWSAFTLPYEFGGKALASVFSGSDVVAWSPSGNRYIGPTDPSFPHPAPGVAYWVRPNGPQPTVTAAGTPLRAQTGAVVPIHRGWNLVGNPYQLPVHWVLGNLTVTRADNGLSASLGLAAQKGWALDIAWGGSTGHTLLYDRSVVSAVNDTVPAYGAFWFFSGVEGTLTLAPPAVVTRQAVGSPSSESWLVGIRARSGETEDAVYLGVGPQPRTFPLPPAVKGGYSLALGGDLTAARPGVGVDIRSAAASQTWDLAVGPSDKPTTLAWADTYRVPRGWSLTLVDPATSRRISLRTESSFVLPASDRTRMLRVELARETAASMAITGLTVSGGRGPAAAVSFQLAQAGQVAVTVTDGAGRAIRTLASRAVAAGPTTLVWDAKDTQGRSVSPGVYLVQVRATSVTGSAARAVASVTVVR